ncbi:MAG: ribosome silencing factor [Candidatus Omnitrophica bacterium]|nr:ribosome silencing factor [Candidatus Omnitrophota bacterium]
MESRKLALRVASVAKSKKAEDVRILDLRSLAAFCDYFVILSAQSLRQTNAIAEAVQDDLSRLNLKPLSRIPAEDKSGWIVLDFRSVIVHIFYKPIREYYSLERLWQDAKKVRVSTRKKSPAR